MPTNRLVAWLAFWGCLAIGAAPVCAQNDRTPALPSWLSSQVTIGDTLYVTDDAGRTTKGRLTQLSASSIELQPSGRFDAAAVRRVKVGDPIWNGVATGALVGYMTPYLIGLVGYAVNYSYFEKHWDGGIHPLAMMGAGMAIGGAVDALRTRTVYRRPDGIASHTVRMGAVVTPAQKSFRVAIRF